VTLLPPPAQDREPHRSRLMDPFWEGCRREELVVQRCDTCGAATFPAAPVCPACRTDTLRWTSARLTGSIYTYTTVWRPASPDFAVPYVVAWIDMDDGWQIMSSVVGCDTEEVAVGAPVIARFAEAGGDQRLPVFALRYGEGPHASVNTCVDKPC
jgi:uncharacterized protein